MLEEILQILGSKHPLRNEPICIADTDYGDGYIEYNCLTESGWKSYNKLIDILYKLRDMNLIPTYDCENIIETLDDIVSNPNLQ